MRPEHSVPAILATPAGLYCLHHPQIARGRPQQRWVRPPDARCCLTPLSRATSSPSVLHVARSLEGKESLDGVVGGDDG
jgi:hypothetical protein